MIPTHITIHLDPEGEAISHLRESDPVMKEVLAMIDVASVSYVVASSGFESLARNLASQFIARDEAESLWTRIAALTGLTPEGFLGTSDKSLRVAGLSYSKIAAIKDLCVKTRSGEIDFERLKEMGDDEAVAELVKLKGISPIDAEMFLIFSLGRPDVFTWRDHALMRAMQYFYGADEKFDAQRAEEISDRWRPYRTTAVIILWETIQRKLIK